MTNICIICVSIKRYCWPIVCRPYDRIMTVDQNIPSAVGQMTVGLMPVDQMSVSKMIFEYNTFNCIIEYCTQGANSLKLCTIYNCETDK